MKRRHLISLGLAVILTLATIGCGSGDTSGGGATGATATTTGGGSGGTSSG